MSEAFERARLGQLAAGREQANALEEFQTRRTNRTAGNALQTGDYAGAAGALYDGGNLEGGMTVQRYGAQAQTADREQQKAAIVAAVTGLLHVPANERPAMLQTRIAPVFEQVGLGQYLTQIGPDDLSDASLRGLATSMGGSIDGPQPFNTRDGIVERDPYSGDYRMGYAVEDAPQTPPAGYRWTDAGGLEAIPGGPADPRTAGSLAASRRAPPRARSSGGGSSRAAAPTGQGRPASSPGGGLPPGFTIRGR